MTEILLHLSQPDAGRPRLDARHSSKWLPRIGARTLKGARETVRHWWERLTYSSLMCSWRYAAALRELDGIDARTMRDIGLHRGDLHAIAYATARRGAFGRFGAVRIRRVEISDLPRAVAFGHLLHPEDVRLRFGRPVALDDSDTFRRLFGLDDRKIETIGAFDVSGAILGLATVARTGPGMAELGLIVRSDLQRRGLGATLLAHVIKNARAAGFHLLLAQIDYGNVPIRRLTRRFGFEIVGDLPASAQLAIAQ